MVLLYETMGVVNDTKIPLILEKIRGEIAGRQAEHSEKRSKTRRIAAGVGAVGLVGAVAVGLPAYYVHENHAEKVAYDARHVELQAEPIDSGSASFVDRQPELFTSYIPGMVDDRIVRSPRLTDIEAGTCARIGSVGIGESIVLVTDGPVEKVFAAVEKSGVVNVCALTDSDESSSSQPDYQIAIQRS